MIFTTFLGFLLASCSSDPLDVDVSAISVPQVKIIRYDSAFYAVDTSHLWKDMYALHDKYGAFNDGFVNNVIFQSGNDSLDKDKDLRFFLSDYAYRDVYRQTQDVFKDGFSVYEDELTDVFKHFRYYFPNDSLPNGIYTCMSGFNYNILYVQGGYYGIGLEYYLGENNVAYEQLQWPKYKSSTRRKEYLVADLVTGWMLTQFPYDPEKNDLLNKMVYEGKILYLKKALMRNEDDSIITGYTGAQLKWCTDNEAMMYSSLIDKKKIYSEDASDLQHYTEDAPFTPDFPRESPGKAGNWLGYRIVQSYMTKNPKVTIAELMATKDAQTILTKAKYKPKF
jgi:hypothetical protein